MEEDIIKGGEERIEGVEMINAKLVCVFDYYTYWVSVAHLTTHNDGGPTLMTNLLGFSYYRAP